MLNSGVVAVQEAMLELWPDNTAILTACDQIWYEGSEVTDEQQQAAWLRLIESIEPKERRMVRKPLLALIAALIAMGILTVALASGILPWTLHITWNDDELHLEIVRTAESVSGSGGSANDVELRDALIENDIGFIQSGLPDGYQLADVDKEVIHEGWTIVNYLFEATGGKQLSVMIESNAPAGAFVQDAEKDASELEVYQTTAVKAYIYENLGRTCAQWMEGVESLITIEGDLSVDELKQMIDSIGGNNDDEET